MITNQDTFGVMIVWLELKDIGSPYRLDDSQKFLKLNFYLGNFQTF
jgi:hypothetical protein